MQKLRNLRLAARLGIAFGALALGLLVVSMVAFSSTNGLKTKVDSLAVEVPQYTATVDGIAARTPDEAHAATEHLYVYDGDLKAQDETAAAFEEMAKADEAAFAGLVRTLSAADDAASREAADGVKQLQTSYMAYLDTIRKAMKVSRQETVDGVEERDASRAMYIEQIVPAHDAIGAAVGETSKGALAFAAGEGKKADDAIASTKRSILIVAIISGLVALVLAVLVTRSVTRPVRALGLRLRSINEHCL
jgi:hypothetical protein